MALTLFVAYIQEHGDTIAFSCSELDLISSEVEKVENWKKRCMDKLGTLLQNGNSLHHALEKVLILKYFPLYDPFLYFIYLGPCLIFSDKTDSG